MFQRHAYMDEMRTAIAACEVRLQDLLRVDHPSKDDEQLLLHVEGASDRGVEEGGWIEFLELDG